MNSTDFTYFKLADEDYTFLGKTFKVPKAQVRNGNVDMFTNGAWKNSGKNVEEVPSISLEEYELSFGLWMTHLSRLYNTVSSFGAEITTPYQLLYQGNHTGFTYTLPYLINQGTIKGPVQNTWGGEETGIGKSFAGSFGANLDQSLSNIGKFFAEGSSYGGAGEKVRRYDSQDNVKSITIKFPLYNTIDKDKTLRNFEFVTLFTLQNLKTRTSWMTYLPPKIYKVNTNSFGGINMPAAFVQSFDATAVGTVRKIRYKGFLDKDILIPEAYEVTITMTELLPESSNTFAATMGGDPVNVIGNTTNTPRLNVNYDQSITPTGLAPIPSADLAYLKKQKDIAEANLTNLQKQTASGATGVVGDNPSAITVNVGNVPSRENLDQAIKAQQETIKFIQTQIDQAPPTIGIQTAGGKVFAFNDLPPGITKGLLTDSSSKSLDIGTGQQSQDTLLNNPKAVAGTLELPQSFLTSALKLSIIAPAAQANQQKQTETLPSYQMNGDGIASQTSISPDQLTNKNNTFTLNDNGAVTTLANRSINSGNGISISTGTPLQDWSLLKTPSDPSLPVKDQLASLAASRADEISNSLNQPIKIETLPTGVAPSYQPGMGVSPDSSKLETALTQNQKNTINDALKTLDNFASYDYNINKPQVYLEGNLLNNPILSKAPDSVRIVNVQVPGVRTPIPFSQMLNPLSKEAADVVIGERQLLDIISVTPGSSPKTTSAAIAGDIPK